MALFAVRPPDVLPVRRRPRLEVLADRRVPAAYHATSDFPLSGTSPRNGGPQR